MVRKSSQKIEKSEALSPYAQILSAIGPKTADATKQLAQALDSVTLFRPEDLFTPMAEVMKDGWSDEGSALVIQAVKDRITSGAAIDPVALTRWIRVHKDDPNGVRDCLAVDPPDGVDIIRVLSRAGSQKVVFLANWQIAQREVVLKKFVGPDAGNRILQRESQTHPLSMAHPNIIETHILQNSKGEQFLVERRLPLVLTDEWLSNGLQEAANLLRDISSALAFLHDQGLIHGDVKPDNIGFEDGRYILLDFGICRPQGAFSVDVTPTGSLRTRAPELLTLEGEHSKASDVWALGATVYNSFIGRYPLFDPKEKPPRISKPTERESFEKVLSLRVKNEWEQRLNLSAIPDQLRPVLGRALERNPEDRISASELVRESETHLSAVLRFREGYSNFSPSEEIEQLSRYLPDKKVLSLMPESQRRELRSRFAFLKSKKGLPKDKTEQLKSIESRLS